MTIARDADGYLVSVPTTSTATVTALDGAGSFNPTLVTRVDGEIQSRNVATELIDGNTAVALVSGDGTAVGSLTFVFDNDTSMYEARTLLNRATVFDLDVPERPIVNMKFVRDGSLRPGMHDEARDVWELQVGFREVTE